jgi:hypothetical protein
MTGRFTCASAVEAGRAGALEDWVHAFLRTAGGNRALSDGLAVAPRRFHGPVTLPLPLLERCAGPEPGMAFRVSREAFERRVEGLADALRAGRDLPPFIVEFRERRLVLSDGNHRLEALRRLGRTTWPAVIWTTGSADGDALEPWCRARLDGEATPPGDSP